MEILEVFNCDNNSLDYGLPREEVHTKKLWHRHVSAWIMNYNGDILLQRRSLTKKKNPGMWSKTGGHVEAGEDTRAAIKREVYEEIGLNVDKIELVNIFKYDSEIEKNYSYSYIIFTDKLESEFILQKEEVDSVKYYTIEELIENKNNLEFCFSKWDNDSFDNDMNILKEYRDKLFNITVKEVYVQLINNKEILNIYKKIEDREILDGGYAYHNMNHINNVTNIATNLLIKLNYDDNTIYKSKIACLLHDTGAIEGKEGHAKRSYEFAKELFKSNNWFFLDSNKILDAIKNHSNGFDDDSILTLTIILADKLDIKSSRITDYGKQIIGNRQYGHILDILIDIQNNKLIINFITDNNLDINEFNDYYFTKKVFKAIESFSNKLNLEYEILIDNRRSYEISNISNFGCFKRFN